MQQSYAYQTSFFFLIPKHVKTTGIYMRAVKDDLWVLVYVIDHLKTQEMWFEAAGSDSNLLKYVFDCYIKLQEMWYEDFNSDG